jgi:hypothetical protein
LTAQSLLLEDLDAEPQTEEVQSPPKSARRSTKLVVQIDEAEDELLNLTMISDTASKAPRKPAVTPKRHTPRQVAPENTTV